MIQVFEKHGEDQIDVLYGDKELPFYVISKNDYRTEYKTKYDDKIIKLSYCNHFWYASFFDEKPQSFNSMNDALHYIFDNLSEYKITTQLLEDYSGMKVIVDVEEYKLEYSAFNNGRNGKKPMLIYYGDYINKSKLHIVFNAKGHHVSIEGKDKKLYSVPSFGNKVEKLIGMVTAKYKRAAL